MVIYFSLPNIKLFLQSFIFNTGTFTTQAYSEPKEYSESCQYTL